MQRPRLRFWHKLALALGMSVRRAQQEIDAAEFCQWVEFDKIDPIGRGRFDLLAGIITSSILNAVVKPKDPTTPSDFMIEYEKSEPTQEDIAAKARMTAALFKQVNNG